MESAEKATAVLRAGGPADAVFVTDLARTAFSDYGEYDRVLPRWLGTRGVATVVAEEGGAPAGFAMLGMRTGLHLGRADAELLAVAVAARARRRGIGRALVREVIAIAERWRVRGVRLHTADTNLVAQRLFAGEGFLAEASRRGFYPNGQGAVAMRRAVERRRRARR
ncbi:MAG: GNAT family N-acetyltransferase [Deltaproteobacteria bacterium]|nr:MAG: GNAT family N-acetyltransferase [Deltaproteobacteria bacterium]